MPEPLVSLDPNGTSAVIAYSVPEPTSYSGRNFINLPLPARAFLVTEQAENDPSTHRSAGDRRRRVGPDGRGASGATDPASILLAPPDVVLSPVEDTTGPLVLSRERSLTPELAVLTRDDVRQVARAGGRTIVYTNIAGQLAHRVVAREGDPYDGSPYWEDDDGSDDPVPEPNPSVSATIDCPATGAVVAVDTTSAIVTVTGRWWAYDLTNVWQSVTLDGTEVDGVGFAADSEVFRGDIRVAGGAHTLTVRVAGTAALGGVVREFAAEQQVAFTVEARPGASDQDPTPPPSITTTAPKDGAVIVLEGDDPVTVTIAGTASAAAQRTLARITVTETLTGRSTGITPATDGDGTWSTEFLFEKPGQGYLEAVATDDTGRDSAPSRTSLAVLGPQSRRRLKTRLMIVETLTLSNFLGDFGAGRVVKTFSLLPGERTTISVKTWTKSDTAKTAANSILDSNAVDSASDFESTLVEEQTSREANSEAFAYKIGANVGAAWGWGSASISAEMSGSANSAREEAVKNVANATRKHAMKASSNRSISVNTEYTETTSSGFEDSTTREIANINVSRTLNFVFRQMNQQHIALVHLTNVRLGLYREDVLLDENGKDLTEDDGAGRKRLAVRSNYEEVPLSQMDRLLTRTLDPSFVGGVRDAVLTTVRAVPDLNDDARSVVEEVTPQGKDGPVAGGRYLRFRKDLQQTCRSSTTGFEVTVPGVVLSQDEIVIRTDGVIVETVLGGGNGLDTYSDELQEVAIAERRAALAEKSADRARDALARKIIADADEEKAKVFALLYPPAPVVAPSEPRP